MTPPSSLADQVVAGAGTAGSISGLGGTFSADPFTGTGRFDVPLPTPPGHGGLHPGLALVYSSGAGAGVCGVGWSFGPPSIGRRTTKGIPLFDEHDVFLLSGDELVGIGDGYYRRRTEGAFARIRRVRRDGADFWAVTERDGTRRLFGRHPAHRDGEPGRPVAWHLSEIRDACDNRVSFSYRYDAAEARAYLVGAAWGPYRLELEYEPRPDVLRSARAGVLLATGQRLREARVQVRHRDTAAAVTFDVLRLDYDQSPITGLSLLAAIHRTGMDADGSSRAVPSVRLRYANPPPSSTPIDVTGHAGRSLADPAQQLVDMNGNGHPDLVESAGHGWLLRSNRGDGTFAPPVPVAGPAVRLTDPGVFLSDVDGTGFADLVTDVGWYPNDGAGFGVQRRFAMRPGIGLQEPDVRIVDIDGDGIGDVLAVSGPALCWYRSQGGSGWDTAVVRPFTGRPLPRVSDRWTRLVDTVGDGLADLVRLTRGSVEVHQNLGFGRFAPMRRIPLPERLPGDVEPEHLLLADVTGTGAADLVVRRGSRTWIYANGSGHSFRPRVELRTRALGAGGAVQPVDLLGTGAGSLLFTEDGDRRAWTLYQPWGATRPDVLTSIDNGIGGVTEVRYGTALAHAARDRAAGRPWRHPQPRPVQVINSIVRWDRTTGNRVGTRFVYHEGYHDAGEREFRGFAITEQLDTETADPRPGAAPARIVRFHHLGNGDSFADRYTPTPAEVAADVVPDAPGALRSLRGAVAREEVFGDDGSALSGRPYQVTHYSYTVMAVVGPPAGGEWVFHPQMTRRDVILTERTAEARITSTRIAFDDTGRSVEVRAIAVGRAAEGEPPVRREQASTSRQVTRHIYVERDVPDPDDGEGYDGPYSPAYLVDRVSRATTHDVDVEGTERLVGEELTFYDGAAYLGLGHPGSGTDVAVVRGNPSCRLQLAFTDELVGALFHDAPDGRAVLDAEGGYLRIGNRLYVQRDRASHNRHGDAVASLDPLGHESTLDYDPVDALFPVRQVNPAGEVVDIGRGELPFLIERWTDANGNVTDYGYDPAGFLSSITEKGRLIDGEWEGDPPSHPTELIEVDMAPPVSITTRKRLGRAGGLVTAVRYLDGATRLIQLRTQAEPDPAHPDTPRYRVSSRMEHDHKGQVVRTFPPVFAATPDYDVLPGNGTATSTATHDPLGRPSRIDYPDGTFTRTERAPWHMRAWDRDDNAGEIDPDDPRYGPHLDQIGPLTGTPVTTHLDPRGQPLDAEHAGQHSRRAFDHLGEVVAAWDARGATEPSWRMGRDLIGRCLRSGHPASHDDHLQVLDAAGHAIWSRDGDGGITRASFDPLGHPMVETSDVGDGPVVRAEWIYGSASDPELDQRHAGRLVEYRDAAGSRAFSYDWRGNVTTTSQRFWLTGAGADDWAEPTSVLWADPDRADGPLPGVSLTLDGLDAPGGLTETVEYDTRGRPVTVHYTGGVELHERYDETAHPSSLSVVAAPGAEPIVVIESYERDAAQREIGVRYGNGVTLRREFDPLTDRLIRQTVTSPAGLLTDISMITSPGGVPLSILDRTRSEDRAPGVVSSTRHFSYDLHSRLIGATGLAHQSATPGRDAVVEPEPEPDRYVPYEVAYDYDGAGNLVRNTEYSADDLGYDPARSDRLRGTAEESSTAYAYDARGNTLATPRCSRLAYDHRGSLRYAESGTAQVHLRYQDNQRALRVTRSEGTTTLTAWLGATEYVSERGPSGTSTRINVRTPGGLVQRVVSGPEPTRAQVSMAHSDELGSLALVTDEQGGLADQEQFFPYGRTSDRRSDLDHPRFLGVDRDPSTGLYLTGPRAYDPAIGRFLQPDPIGDEQPDWSPYAYGKASPMRFADPSGYQPVTFPWLAYSVLTGEDWVPEALSGMADTADRLANAFGVHFVGPLVDSLTTPANAPTGKSADTRGSPVDMTLGLLSVVPVAKAGLVARPVVVGAGGVLATRTAATVRAASSGATRPQTYWALAGWYRSAIRPKIPMDVIEAIRYGMREVDGVRRTHGLVLGMQQSGLVSIYRGSIRELARAGNLDPVDLLWETVRHEWVHLKVTQVSRTLGVERLRDRLYNMGGVWTFAEEYGAHVIGKGSPIGVASAVYQNYDLPNLGRDLGVLLAGGSYAGLLAGGTAIRGGTTGLQFYGTYQYFFSAPPPEPVLPPITLP